MARATRVVGAVILAIAAGMVEAQAAEKVRIGLSTAQASPYVGFYAAQELGYYKSAGLDVELTTYRGGAAAQEAMSAGAADLVTIFTGGLAIAATKGEKAKIVATIESRAFGWHLLVTDPKFKTIRDLDNAKVGITAKGTATDMFASAAARAAGVKIQMVPVGAGGLVPSLQSRRVDAIILYPSVTFQQIESKQSRSLFDFGRDFEEVVPDVLVASAEFMSKRPDVLRATVAAVYKATRHVQENRTWGLQFIKRYTQETDDKINEITYDEVIKRLSPNGVTDVAWVRRSLQVSGEAWENKAVSALNPEALFSNDYLPKN
jgi:NitT/TauT family transport system substrate-binding protein